MAVFSGNGSETSPSFTFSSDTNTGIYRADADKLAFTTAGSRRMVIASDGKIGVGTDTPGGVIDAHGATGTTIIRAVGADTNGFADMEIFSTGTSGGSRLYFSDTAAQSGLIRYTHSSNSLEFHTDSAEAARINDSQQLLVGVTSAYNGTAAIQTDQQIVANRGIIYGANTDLSTFPGNLVTWNTAGDNINGHTVVFDLSTIFGGGNSVMVIKLDFSMIRSFTGGADQASTYSGQFTLTRTSSNVYLTNRTDFVTAGMTVVSSVLSAGPTLTFTFNTSNVRIGYFARAVRFSGGNTYIGWA